MTPLLVDNYLREKSTAGANLVFQNSQRKNSNVNVEIRAF